MRVSRSRKPPISPNTQVILLETTPDAKPAGFLEPKLHNFVAELQMQEKASEQVRTRQLVITKLISITALQVRVDVSVAGTRGE